MRGLLPLEAKKIFCNKVNKVNQHSAISAYTQYGDDDKLRTIAGNDWA